jgi:broad specificity phosphatase PhoE
MFRVSRKPKADSLVLVKHALPVFQAERPPAQWSLGPEGEVQARVLAERLRGFMPLRLISSPEPKALRTCELVAEALGAPMKTIDDLRELDRPAWPWMEPAEHERVNAEVFTARYQRVLGRESADQALSRFDAAVRSELDVADSRNLVVVAHGTVISLFVGRYGGIDEFELWRRLQCPSFVVMAGADLVVREVEERVG